MQPRKILFLCTGNSCRSQIAEGWTRALHGGSLEPNSAGVAPTSLDPRAARVMAEAGVDISGQRSEHVDRYLDAGIETVVTVCDGARESCPVFPGDAVVMHAGFDDPPALAASAGSEEEKLGIYRRVRDEIREYIERLPALLMDGEDG